MSALGVMGEDATDVDTIRVLLRRILPKEVKIIARAPHRGGSAALRKAAAAYMSDLQQKGCAGVVLVHDLDLDPNNNQLNDETKLRQHLAQRIGTSAHIEHLICIPVEELEAWFWSDQGVLDLIGKGLAKARTSPHLVKKPKEELFALSRKAHHKPVYSTNDNPRLAERLDLNLCAQRCPAFRELRDFAVRLFGTT